MRPLAEQRNVSRSPSPGCRHQKVVSSVIIGAQRLDQLDDNIAAADIELTEQELDALDRVSALPKEYPGWMFETQASRAKQLALASRKTAR